MLRYVTGIASSTFNSFIWEFFQKKVTNLFEKEKLYLPETRFLRVCRISENCLPFTPEFIADVRHKSKIQVWPQSTRIYLPSGHTT